MCPMNPMLIQPVYATAYQAEQRKPRRRFL
jgi:hypothetical protein